MKNLDIIVLAAGKGSRMNSDSPKILVPLLGKPLITYLLDSLKTLNIKNTVNLVISPDHEDLLKNALKDYEYNIFIQQEKLGTGDALNSVLKTDKILSENILLLLADHPLLTTNSIAKLYESHIQNNAMITLLTTIVPNFNPPYENFYHDGRFTRDKDNKITGIVEFNDASDEEKNIREMNPAMYAFNTKWIKEHINKIPLNEKKGEYYLTSIVEIAKDENTHINSFSIEAIEAYGVNTLDELKQVEQILKYKKNEK